MATVLLTGAALLAHSFIKLSTFDKGYDPANVLAFNLLFPDTYSTARKGETIELLLTRFRVESRRAGRWLRASRPVDRRGALHRHVRASGQNAGGRRRPRSTSARDP